MQLFIFISVIFQDTLQTWDFKLAGGFLNQGLLWIFMLDI